MKIITSFLLLFLLFSCEKTLLTITKERPTLHIQNDELIINGVLGKTFYKSFKTIVLNNPQIKTVVFNRVPGSINDEWNVKSCLLLHENKLNTKLTDSSMIASGGVDLFISGIERTGVKESQIGVHSWRDLKKDGSEYPRNSSEHKLFIDFFEKIDIDTSFYWFTLRAAPAKDIHWMTADEVNKYHLFTESSDSL